MCFFLIIRFFFSKAFGYGNLLVNYGRITGRNLQFLFPLKMHVFQKILKKNMFFDFNPKKWYVRFQTVNLVGGVNPSCKILVSWDYYSQDMEK